jgi:hypothetical protein
MRALAAVIISALVGACTTLGPMPVTTGVSAIPAERPGVEVQAGIVPGFYLSDSAQGSNAGQPSSQLSLLLEPDKLLGLPGLIVGAREIGGGGDSYLEPYIGYRRRVAPAVSFAAIGYGTATSATSGGASYSATRLGAEVAADIRLLEIADFVSVHWQVAAQVTEIDATGRYCIDNNGLGTDCSTPGSMAAASDVMTSGYVSGAFPAGTATLSFDLGHRPTGVFHDLRLALMASAGQMPQLVYGQESGRATFTSWGLSLTLGLGADKR